MTPATSATFSGVAIPELVFVSFQMTFASITAGADRRRLRRADEFSAVMLFAVLWVTIVYFPIAHMVWWRAGRDSADVASATDAKAG